MTITRVNRQWHIPGILPPVSGEHCVVYLKQGTPGYGLGDAPDGLTYMFAGWFFAVAGDVREIHPLVEPPIIQGPFFWLTDTRIIRADDVEYWHPMVDPPGIEVPEGSIACAKCSGTMRHAPGHPGHFRCVTCGRVIQSSFTVVVEGGLARPK